MGHRSERESSAAEAACRWWAACRRARRSAGSVLPSALMVTLMSVTLTWQAHAGFNAQTVNPSNSFAAAAVFPPDAPTGVTATAGDTQVTVSWTAGAGATSSTVQYRPQSGGSWTARSAVAGTSDTVTGLTNGTTYEFQVEATNSAGSSAWTPATPVTGTPAAASTPTIVTSTTSAANVSGTSLTVNKPAGVSNNDVLVAAVTKGTATGAWNVPAGWSQVAQKDGGQVDLAVFTKVITNAAGEPASYSFTSSQTAQLLGAITLVRGANTTTPVDVSSVNSGASGSPVATSVTTTGTNRLLLAFDTNDDVGTYTPPAGMSEQYDFQTNAGTTDAGLTLATAGQAAAGASGNKSFTNSLGTTWATALIAIQP